MGWLYLRDMGPHGTARAYLDAQFTYACDDHRLTVLTSSMVGRTYYAAVERVQAAGDHEVFGLVCLTRTSTGARDGCTFGYKDMSESMGPYASDCPAAILDRLTETTNEQARAWRARCRASLAARRIRRARPTPRPGQTIIFDEALRFSDGHERSRFEVIANPRGRTPLFRDPKSGAICRITAFRTRDYRLVDPAVVPARTPP